MLVRSGTRCILVQSGGIKEFHLQLIVGQFRSQLEPERLPDAVLSCSRTAKLLVRS